MDDRHESRSAPLLVRCAPESALDHVLTLLRGTGVAAGTIVDCAGRGTLLVLSDVTLPPTAPPLAAAAVRCRGDEADLEAVGVARELCRRGLGRRLLTGTFTLLRAQGIHRVTATAPQGTPTAALLAGTGFNPDADAIAPVQRWTKWL